MDIFVEFQPDITILMIPGGELTMQLWPKNWGTGENGLKMMPVLQTANPESDWSWFVDVCQ
jgi:hypothetical protein